MIAGTMLGVHRIKAMESKKYWEKVCKVWAPKYCTNIENFAIQNSIYDIKWGLHTLVTFSPYFLLLRKLLRGVFKNFRRRQLLRRREFVPTHPVGANW
jgi:hypothetical protein